MATRRSPSEIAEALEARAANMRYEADRRRSVSADEICNRLWEAECSLHRARLCAPDGEDAAACGELAESVRGLREARWARLKKELDTP